MRIVFIQLPNYTFAHAFQHSFIKLLMDSNKMQVFLSPFLFIFIERYDYESENIVRSYFSQKGTIIQIRTTKLLLPVCLPVMNFSLLATR